VVSVKAVFFAGPTACCRFHSLLFFAVEPSKAVGAFCPNNLGFSCCLSYMGSFFCLVVLCFLEISRLCLSRRRSPPPSCPIFLASRPPIRICPPVRPSLTRKALHLLSRLFCLGLNLLFCLLFFVFTPNLVVILYHMLSFFLVFVSPFFYDFSGLFCWVRSCWSFFYRCFFIPPVPSACLG